MEAKNHMVKTLDGDEKPRGEKSKTAGEGRYREKVLKSERIHVCKWMHTYVSMYKCSMKKNV